MYKVYKCILLGDQGSQWFNSLKYMNKNYKFYASNHTLIIKNKSNIKLEYLYYYYLFTDLKKFNKDSAMIAELNKKNLNNQKFHYLPSKSNNKL